MSRDILNNFNIYSARVIGREVLCFYLLAVFKQISYYYSVDLFDVLLKIKFKSLKFFYYPLIYVFDIKYYLFVPVTTFFIFFRFNLLFMIYCYYHYLFILGINLLCSVFFFNIYIYIIFFFKRKILYLYKTRLRFKHKYRVIRKKYRSRRVRYNRLFFYISKILKRKKFRYFLKKKRLKRRLRFLERIIYSKFL